MNQSNDSLIDYNGQFYIGAHGSIYITYLVLSTAGIVLGTTGNLIVALTILCHRKLMVNSAYVLMVNLSVADFFIALFAHTFTDFGIIFGQDLYGRVPGLCKALAAVCLINCGTSLVNMCILAVNRYLNICHHQIYLKVFTFRRTVLSCMFTWLAGIVVSLPNFVGWGGYFFDPKSADCIWDRLASPSYSLFFTISAIFVPCFCIFNCYLRIFIFAFESKSRVSSGVAHSHGHSHDVANSLKITRALFAAFALFVVCWLPYGIIVSVDFGDAMPMGVHALTTLMAHMNSVLNPYIYILFNPVFKESVFRVVARIFKLAESRSSSVTWAMSLSHQNNSIDATGKSLTHKPTLGPATAASKASSAAPKARLEH